MYHCLLKQNTIVFSQNIVLLTRQKQIYDNAGQLQTDGKVHQFWGYVGDPSFA